MYLFIQAPNSIKNVNTQTHIISYKKAAMTPGASFTNMD